MNTQTRELDGHGRLSLVEKDPLEHVTQLLSWMGDDAIQLLQEGVISTGREMVRCRVGQVIWEHDAPADTTVVCLKGLLKVCLPEPGCRLVQLVLPGELVSWDYLLPEPRHFGSLIAGTDAVILRSNVEGLESWLREGPTAVMTTLRHNAIMADRAQRRVAALTSGGVSTRLARLLLLVLERASAVGLSGERIDLALTQVEVASLIGARRESIARQVARMRREGILEWDRFTIRVLDPERLRAEA